MIQMASGKTIDQSELQDNGDNEPNITLITEDGVVPPMANAGDVEMRHEFQFDENMQPILDDRGKPVVIRTPILPDAATQELAANATAAAQRLHKVRRGHLDAGQSRFERIEYRPQDTCGTRRRRGKRRCKR